jgi:acyl-CoA synthetase (AMP-forming)/AMP-acid ligase II
VVIQWWWLSPGCTIGRRYPRASGLQRYVSDTAKTHVLVSTESRIRSGSVGLLFPNTECKLLDDDGKEVGPGERGEIYMRGPHICMGYWKNKAATEESLSPDGWLKTGDIAIAKDGWLWIVDRKKVERDVLRYLRRKRSLIFAGTHKSQRLSGGSCRAGSGAARKRRYC